MVMAAPRVQRTGVLQPQSTDVATAATPTKPLAPTPPLPRRPRYIGVQRSPCGRWTAHVVDPATRATRAIGLFPDEHAAALAHDRVAIALHGDGARLNFGAAFHPVEHKFLLRCQQRRGVAEVCDIVADGSYEALYVAFLRTVFAMERYGDFMDVMLEFYIDRAAQIGEDALVAGGEKLAARFVEMHTNKAVDPVWRDWYHRKVARCIAERQQKMMKQQQFAEQNNASNDNSSSSSTVLS